MRLSQIKLAGFKSFVDPTTISFPSNRVGVVGPNGCGKSNVIDAVRWVMGESSAKTLRGSSMSDVIFNGSRNRKPADYAEIELVFSESDLPQYPGMEEIAIKRRLGRDNQSQYFLNGVRCRRKDITGIFLGTGLGPRSYAIIEQGMISRFIEAKPDELRIFLEEAAGISRYKEKRRETELRMQHTQENLERLSDLNQELDKQVDKLKRQVRAAERYKQLKEAEHLLKGQLLAMRWNKYNSAVEQQDETITGQAEVLQQLQQRLSELESLYEEKRQAHSEANVTFNQVQTQYYTHQSELERLQQSIEHSKEKQEQIEWELEQAETSYQQTKQTLEADEGRLIALETDSFALAQQLEELQMRCDAAHEQLQSAQDQFQTIEIRWEHFNQQAAEPAQQIKVEKNQIHHLDINLAKNRQRLQRLEAENRELDLGSLEHELSDLNTQVAEFELQLEAQQAELLHTQDAVTQQREQQEQTTQQLHQQQSQIQKAQGRLSSLEALQESALGKGDSDLEEWLQEREVSADTPRLAQQLNVEAGWERAVETVLGDYLEGLCLSQMNQLLARLDSLPQAKLNLIDTQTEMSHASLTHNKAVRLVDKISANWDVESLLAGVYVADNLAEALQLRVQLAPYESVITAQGLWLGINWLSINEERDQRAGVFAREQDIQRLQTEIEQLTQSIERLNQQLEQRKTDIAQTETLRQQQQQHINQIQQQLTQLKTSHGGQAAKLEQMSVRARQLLTEHSELNEAIQQDALALEEAGERLIQAEAHLENYEVEREALSEQRKQQRETVEQTRQAWQMSRDALQQNQSRLQTLKTEEAGLRQSIERLQIQIEDLQEKRHTLQSNLEQEQPLDEWQAQYEEHAERQQLLSEDLQHAQDTLKHLDTELRQIEEEQRTIEGQIGLIRSTLEQGKLDHQSNLVRRQTLEEQLKEGEYDIEKLLTEMPQEATEEVWQEGIEDIERKILRLGSINLAALEEYEEQKGRQDYLTEQREDLEKALRMLEQAIAEIDNETRTILQKTLDTVNAGFQAMFPRLFGGGQSNLRLTGDDILTSGIAVMARPPGKRNSTIHLLSGGEKALTAVALVFAIFELNPAPFCMLDEVDAPLDDTNVGRFCDLVRSMSEHVQFIFISHNKIAMEMADQLVGVTMQEAGVSRPVSVDIDLAIEMATA